jgi:hypothetical protein
VAFYTLGVAQKKKRGGRVTPKGGHAPSHTHSTNAQSINPNSRYTPPVPEYKKQSPQWVPVLMFVLLGLGALIILFYYLGFVPGGRSNWYLALGLSSLLGGLYTATKYH